MLNYLRKKMFELKSLKKSVIYLVILFTMLFAITIAAISSLTLFNMKINSMQHNQTQLLKQIKYDVNKFILQVEKISFYLKKNTKNTNLFLENIINMNSTISTIMILNKNGSIKTIHSNCDKRIIDYQNYSKKVYVKHLNGKADSYWSDILISSLDKTASFVYSFKLKDEIVVVYISLNELAQLSNNLKNNDGSYMIRILDSKGAFILNEDNPKLVKEKFNTINTTLYKDLINKEKEYTITTFNNVSHGTMDYGMYTNLEKTNWKIVIRQNYSLMEQYLFDLIIVILITVIIFALIAIYFSYRFLNNIFGSLDRFQVQTSNIANGNYNNILEPTYFHEFNKLFLSFEKMRFEINAREKTLRNNLDNFKTLINSTMEGLVIHDTNTCIDINDVAVELLGYKSKEELLGASVENHISKRYRNLVKKHFKNNKFTKEPIEYQILTKDNKIKTVLGKGQEIEFEGRKLRISAFLDITNIKNQERIIIQQSKLASIGEMLTNIAHHWRQPLSTISTLSSGMKLENDLNILSTKKLSEGLSQINNTTQMLSTTINNFSDYFEPKKDIENFDLTDVLANSISFFEPIFSKHKINTLISYEDKNILRGYPYELTQVIVNIFNNSKDAFILNKIQNRHLIISTYKEVDKYVLSIKDSAGGIKNDLLEKIFDPYFTTKHKYKGTGLGLYMCHEIIVKHMDGIIYAKNVTFEIDKKEFKGLEIVIEFKI